MDVLVLGAKSALAVLLVVAAGAKLADLPGFASAVRLFVPRPAPWPILRAAALGIALAEFALGAASLSSPAAGWLNPVVWAVGCAFIAVSGAGYAFHRGRSCRCFGALSQRRFDAAGIARSILIAAVAAVAMAPVQPSSVRLTATARFLLLAAAALLAFAALTAARVLAMSRETQPRLASEPAAALPSAPQPSAPQPSAPQPSAPQPSAPQPSAPRPGLASP
jgi:hypothetical protein